MILDAVTTAPPTSLPVRPGNRRGFAESDARRREQRRGVSLLATIDRRAFAFAPRDDRVGFVPESVPDDDANDRPVGDGESNVADAAVRAGREAHDVDVRPRADAPFVRAARGGALAAVARLVATPNDRTPGVGRPTRVMSLRSFGYARLACRRRCATKKPRVA